MANYVTRADAGALIRPDVLSGIFEASKEYTSLVMSLGDRISVGTKETIIPVAGTKPVADFVEKTGTQAKPTAGVYPAVAEADAPDIGYKPVSKVTVGDARLILEKIAVIIPLSDCVMEDMVDAATFEDHIRRKCEEAIGKRFDQAAVLGINAPETYGSGIVPSAIAKGNVVDVAKSATAAQKLAALENAYAKVEEGGYEVDAVAASVKFKSVFRNAMASSNVLVTPDTITNKPVYNYYGVPVSTASIFNNTDYLAVAGQWKNVKWGVRNSFEITSTNSGTITDADGSTFNLFQQDMTALRVVLRIGYVVLNEADTYPLAVVRETA